MRSVNKCTILAAALLPGPDASTREGTGVASARHDARESTRLALLARGREREGR